MYRLLNAKTRSAYHSHVPCINPVKVVSPTRTNSLSHLTLQNLPSLLLFCKRRSRYFDVSQIQLQDLGGSSHRGSGEVYNTRVFTIHMLWLFTFYVGNEGQLFKWYGIHRSIAHIVYRRANVHSSPVEGVSVGSTLSIVAKTDETQPHAPHMAFFLH